jgi:integrase
MRRFDASPRRATPKGHTFISRAAPRSETLPKSSSLPRSGHTTAHDRGIDLLAPALTVGQWLDVWLSDIKGFDGTRPRTLTLYVGLADRYVRPVIGGVRLDKLTPAHVQRLVTETRNSQTSRGTPPSASTLRHVYKLIRNALGDAYRMELVTRNVATQVKAPPISKERRVGLDIAEAKRLLDVIDGERLEALYVLALMTGLRRGELLALRWDDIEAKNVPDRVIMEVLGHAEIGVTMNTYAHVLPVLRQEAADAMDELFGA